jgi:DNA polymerase-4
VRRAIGQRLRITVSEGIASNKLVSAIASKLNKPAGFQQIQAGRETEFLHPLPAKWLPGVGPVLEGRLHAAGLSWIRQVASTPTEMLHLLVGAQAPVLRQFAMGIDERPLLAAREPQKTFSQQETFASDLTDEGYVEALLRRMADRLFASVRAEERSVRTLTVKVRYNDLAEDQASESLVEPTDLETDVYGRLAWLLHKAWTQAPSRRPAPIRPGFQNALKRRGSPPAALWRGTGSRKATASAMPHAIRQTGSLPIWPSSWRAAALC